CAVRHRHRRPIDGLHRRAPAALLRAMSNSDTSQPDLLDDSLGLTQERFGFTLFVSLCVHAVLILGVGFTVASQRPDSMLDITLATFESELAPEDADFLAQANQQGSGSESEALAPATDVEARFSDTVIRDVEEFLEERPTSPPTAEAP